MAKVVLELRRSTKRPTKVAEPRSTREIKEAIATLWTEHHQRVEVLEKELKAAKLLRQEQCPHPADKVRIRRESYFEQGRMRSPAEWKVRYCKRCGKELATSHDEVKEVWVEKP